MGGKHGDVDGEHDRISDICEELMAGILIGRDLGVWALIGYLFIYRTK